MSLVFKKKKEPVVVPDLGPQTTSRKEETFKVAGVSFRQSTLAKLGKKNPDYALKDAELKKRYPTSYVYEYVYAPIVPELVAEPENEHDPNAIAIYANGEKIGYVKKGSTSRVRNIMKDRKLIDMRLEIKGGNRRGYFSDIDSVQKDSCDLRADLIITHAEK